MVQFKQGCYYTDQNNNWIPNEALPYPVLHKIQDLAYQSLDFNQKTFPPYFPTYIISDVPYDHYGLCMDMYYESIIDKIFKKLSPNTLVNLILLLNDESVKKKLYLVHSDSLTSQVYDLVFETFQLCETTEDIMCGMYYTQFPEQDKF